METADQIALLKQLLTEAEAYHQAGNPSDAAYKLETMRSHLNANNPVIKGTPPPIPESPPPPEEPGPRQRGDAG